MKPTPVGFKWECHEGMTAELPKLHQSDYESGFHSITDCQEACNAVKGCAVVNLHQTDMHCHVLTGAVTQKAYEAALHKQPKGAYESCMLIKSIDSL